MNISLFAAILASINRVDTPRRSITSGNRIHRDRARDGSPEALRAIAAADAKRARKRARK